MSAVDLKTLEAKIDELIQTCDKLVEENQALRKRQVGLLSERTALLEKTAKARSRLDNMINRLKAMEAES